LNNNVKKIILSILIIGVITVLDQHIKQIVVNNFSVGEGITLINRLLSITYRQNTGIAFSLFNMSHSGVLIALSCVIVVLLALFLRPYFKYRWTFLFGSFIIGGALGNLIDRAFRYDATLSKNFVVDYIEFNFFPTFNLADIFITIGVIMLAIYIIYQENRQQTDKDESKITC